MCKLFKAGGDHKYPNKMDYFCKKPRAWGLQATKESKEALKKFLQVVGMQLPENKNPFLK